MEVHAMCALFWCVCEYIIYIYMALANVHAQSPYNYFITQKPLIHSTSLPSKHFCKTSMYTSIAQM